MSNDKGTSEHEEVRPIWKIADEILATWGKPNYAAKPYIDAMKQLGSVNDNFYLDSGQEIVIRFLGNASGWRGNDARRIKSELRTALDNVDKAKADENMNEAYRRQTGKYQHNQEGQ